MAVYIWEAVKLSQNVLLAVSDKLQAGVLFYCISLNGSNDTISG